MLANRQALAHFCVRTTVRAAGIGALELMRIDAYSLLDLRAGVTFGDGQSLIALGAMCQSTLPMISRGRRAALGAE
jgi:hypothetical protein